MWDLKKIKKIKNILFIYSTDMCWSCLVPRCVYNTTSLGDFKGQQLPQRGVEVLSVVVDLLSPRLTISTILTKKSDGWASPLPPPPPPSSSSSAALWVLCCQRSFTKKTWAPKVMQNSPHYLCYVSLVPYTQEGFKLIFLFSFPFLFVECDEFHSQGSSGLIIVKKKLHDDHPPPPTILPCTWEIFNFLIN